MNQFYNKLEKKFGRHSISNLTLYLIVGFVIGYLLEYIAPNLYAYITLNPYAILHGQVWRLVTWIIAPPSSLNIFTIIMLFFYYSIGSALERTWGTFRYNLYVFSGILFTIVGAFVAYFIMLHMNFGTVNASAQFPMAVGTIVGYSVSTYYICLTMMLAFGAVFPNEVVYLYMIIPIKMKWFAIFDGVMILLDFIGTHNMALRVIILASVLNFLIFFLSSRNYKSVSPHRMKQKKVYKEAQKIHPQYANGARHRCYICGRTELDDPNLEFRYCSKCNGNYEYCQDHLFTHEHVK